ncbi:MAG: retroviral-like aspartic protease family protein [Bacteroidia bacterium]|nr:retroviral-like aspartic protease family protein [Bacteroidia bacterium]
MSAFTVLFDRVTNVIHTQLGISDEASEANVQQIKTYPTYAIWDTGASGCAITSKVVAELGLKPTSSVRVFTATGEVMQNVYLLCFHLPNNLSINLSVTEVPALPHKFEALIGMSIISHGDFTISNFEGRTCLSFRMPSQARTDYTGTDESPSR